MNVDVSVCSTQWWNYSTQDLSFIIGMLDGVKVARLWDFVHKKIFQFSQKIAFFKKKIKKYPMLLLIPPRVCVQSFMMIGWMVFAWWCNKQTGFRIYNVSKIVHTFAARYRHLSLANYCMYFRLPRNKMKNSISRAILSTLRIRDNDIRTKF